MVDRGSGGSIVNVSSIGAKLGFSTCSVYSASKAALDQFSRVMAIELGPHQVRLIVSFSTCPYFIFIHIHMSFGGQL